jgi:hypothetical protein
MPITGSQATRGFFGRMSGSEHAPSDGAFDTARMQSGVAGYKEAARVAPSPPIPTKEIAMQESPKQRPHFPRILDSRRRAQEQSNAAPPKKRDAPPAEQPASMAARARDEIRSPARVDEQG